MREKVRKRCRYRELEVQLYKSINNGGLEPDLNTIRRPKNRTFFGDQEK